MGVKSFLINKSHITIYNYTRYEFRAIQNLDTKDWKYINRLRSRFGIEFPFSTTDKAWKSSHIYGLADVEPYYVFETQKFDPVLISAGLGYIVSDYLRMEFIYHMQLTQSIGSDGLKYTDNLFRVNVKIGLQEGILQRINNPNKKE